MRSRTKALAVALLALAGFFALGAAGMLGGITGPAASAVSAASAPLYRIASAIRRAQESVSRGSLTQEPTERLITENAALRVLAAENAALKDALEYRDRFADTTLVARVVSPTSTAAFRGMVIDRGEDDGVRVGQPVITVDGILVGKITSVRARTAAVLLLSDSRSKAAVTIQDKDGTIGVLEGDRGLAMTIGLIPLAASLAPGDTVVTSGLETGIRRGIPVGTIESVSRNAQDPFQTASVAPFPSAAHPAIVQVLLTPSFE